VRRGSIATAGLGVALSLAVPAGASAATIALDHPCYAEQQPIAVTGGGFTPGAAVKLTFADGTYAGQLTADAAGNITGTASAPVLTATELSSTVTATDQANPAVTAAAPLQISKLQVSTVPSRARPHSTVTYRARGFTPGGTLYGHYIFKNKLRKNVRVGKVTGPCGTITRRMDLLPLRRIRYGSWTVQFDLRKSYSRSAQPAVRGTLLIFRSLRVR
jgi:hypothetical protein